MFAVDVYLSQMVDLIPYTQADGNNMICAEYTYCTSELIQIATVFQQLSGKKFHNQY